ncbi:hypothetical protein IKP85_03980 [bacterium]|nr:hypothetical protein [bacterium]
MIYILPKLNYNTGINYNKQNYTTPAYTRYNQPYDTVEFTGKSLPSEYKTVFEYLSAEILGKNKRFPVGGNLLSASKIKEAVNNLFKSNLIFENFEKSDVNKIKWHSYIPQDIRSFSIDKINIAREVRLKQWANILESPETNKEINPKLAKKLKDNQPLKLVIWDAITSEIKADNRHIPVPFNAKALYETIERFEIIHPKDRAVTCAKPSFLEFYTHRLRDNLLMEMGLSNKEAVWVKIPSLKHDPHHQEENIAKLEILSNKNWCTRSSMDKAREALMDGDFYIYLKRNKSSRIWEAVTGMTTHKGKIEQIQGKENDNIVPLNLVGEIKDFIKTSGLQCNSGVIDEGPKAIQAILISEKLNEKNPVSGKTFFKAIKDKDYNTVFVFLNKSVRRNENGLLEIENYKPYYNLNAEHGYVVPYSMFGINENELLSQVEKIDGDLVLCHKNKLFNSEITVFPPNLKSVGGRVICNNEQYMKFQDDILRIVDGDVKRIFISGI